MDTELSAWRDNGGFVTVPPLDLSVFYTQFGKENAPASKTLLLLHGFPESSFSYHKIVDGMLAVFDRIVIFDMPGYGFSDKPGYEYSYSLVPQADVALQVWQHLGVTGGHTLSHDMGTSVLTEIVARHVNQQLPTWFSGGLQSATFTNGSMVLAFAKLRLMQKLLLNKKIGPLISSQSSYSLFKKTMLSAHGVGLDQTHGLSERDIELLWQNCVEQEGHLKNHHTIRYLNDRRRYEKTRWLPALSIASETLPLHFCWGNADQVARIEMAYYLHQKICPNSTLSVMPGVGHFCQIGSPDAWVQAVSPFY